MFFRIESANGLAIYEQIVRQVKFAVAGDALQAGDLVPSVRELSRDLAVNPNTVARAYRELQVEGVLAPVRGTGLEITAHAAKHCAAERVALIRERLRSVLLEARRSRLDLDDIRALVDEELSRLEKPVREKDGLEKNAPVKNDTDKKGKTP
ncbi:MAG TPA: GntR family transcriptional regulator [Planctomycetaceae bacterium]|jgi:GntR family transcriptional regulator